MNFLSRIINRVFHRLPNSLEFVYLNWNKLGSEDPLWAISSHDDKKGGKWGLDDFFAEGTGTIQFLFDEMKSNGVSFNEGKALDFGCGVGRLTQALAARFQETHGVDIADTMIHTAERLNRFKNRCFYHVNQSPDLSLFPENSMDFVLSLITLQHIPRDYSRQYIQEFFRISRPGGVVYFQVPARRKDGLNEMKIPDNPQAALKKQGAVMLMNGILRDEVEDLVVKSGGSLAYVIEDPWSGEEWESYRYCAIKK